MEEVLKAKLEALSPLSLTIIDESHKHKGHQPNMPAIGTHFKITIVAECFAGQSQINRHKLIYKALEKELQGTIHALSIKAMTPDEYNL